jgi:hypothetical protein
VLRSDVLVPLCIYDLEIGLSIAPPPLRISPCQESDWGGGGVRSALGVPPQPQAGGVEPEGRWRVEADVAR